MLKHDACGQQSHAHIASRLGWRPHAVEPLGRWWQRPKRWWCCFDKESRAATVWTSQRKTSQEGHLILAGLTFQPLDCYAPVCQIPQKKPHTVRTMMSFEKVGIRRFACSQGDFQKQNPQDRTTSVDASSYPLQGPPDRVYVCVCQHVFS